MLICTLTSSPRVTYIPVFQIPFAFYSFQVISSFFYELGLSSLKSAANLEWQKTKCWRINVIILPTGRTYLYFFKNFTKECVFVELLYSKFKCSICNIWFTGYIKIFSVNNKKNDPKIAKDLKWWDNQVNYLPNSDNLKLKN